MLKTFVFSKIYLLCANAIFFNEQIPSESQLITPIDFNLFATISFNSDDLINRAHSHEHMHVREYCGSNGDTRLGEKITLKELQPAFLFPTRF